MSLSLTELARDPNSTGQLLKQSFVLVGALILFGGAIAVWQISVMRSRAKQLYDAEQPGIAVLVAHSDFQRLQSDLRLVAETHDVERFTVSANQMRRAFNEDIDRALRALQFLRPGAERERQSTALEAIRTTFSSQMDSLIALARLGDWQAVELRAQSRAPVHSALSDALVRDIDTLVAAEKAQELEDIERAGTGAMLTLFAIALATLVIAGFLGWKVTQTIAGRLEQLDAAARALGRGEFQHRVPVAGNDEIGRLARVFNDMSVQLSELYESLRRSEARFRSLFESVSDFILVLDAAGVILFASPSFERAAAEGHSVTGENLIDFVADEDRPALRNLIEGFQGPNLHDNVDFARTEAQFRFRRHDGQIRALEVNGTNLLQNPHVKGIVVNARDVTERRRLEEQLFRSQKLEAIGTLSGGVAHDFNNLLTVILGHTEILLQQARASSETRDHLQRIEQASRRASALTRQLLAFSRRQVMQPKVFNLSSLIEDLEKMLRRMIREDIEFRIVADAELGPTKADPSQIEQVVMNLVVNARDAMVNGGRLTIETRNVTLDRDYVHLHEGARPGQYVMLAVSDTGEGIQPEILPHIFEPFFTTKELGKGTGLGLSTVYGIVKQSGGYIWVYSEPGCGTTFKIYFPRVDEPVALVAEVAPPTLSSGNEVILLVEDEPELRALIKSTLVARGFTVLDASSPEDALSLSSNNLVLHLLLTDIVMPGMNGPQLAKQIQHIRPGLKVLYMSGYATNFITQDGVVNPDTNYIEKPFDPATLIRRVREVLDGTSASSAHN